jgi:sarcosine oxidase
MSVEDNYDAVVVGLGGVGSFALRALSKDGNSNSKRILGIEASDLAHAGYSSRGKTRIFRRAYFEHPNYVPWIQHSVSVIQELEQSSGESLLNPCGTLLLEPLSAASAETDKVDSFEKNASNADERLRNMPPMLRASLASAQQHGIPVEYLDPGELKKRFPQFQYNQGDDMVGLLEPDGGFLRPEKIMRAALREAQQSRNVTIWHQTKLIRFQQIALDTIKENDDGASRQCSGDFGVELHLLKTQANGKEETTVIRTRKLLLALGGWTIQVIPSWQSILFPIRQVQAWIDVSQNDSKHLYSSRNMPGFIYVSSTNLESSFYGLPGDDEDEQCTHWVKVAEHNLNLQDSCPAPSIHPSQNTSSSSTNCSPVASDIEISRVRSLIPLVLNERAWKTKDHHRPASGSNDKPTIVEARPCMYTVTPDHHFIIGSPLDCSHNNNIFVVAGLSGHGYKMVAALGQMMADFALDKNVEEIWKTEFCSPRRFGV